jgi:hypothetical protein
MPRTRPGRPDAAEPDRHDWWTVRFTWPDQGTGGEPGFTYAMRPTREAIVNCASLMLIRGRQRGITSERPIRAHVRPPQGDRWHAVPTPWHRSAADDRPAPDAPRDARGSQAPPPPRALTSARMLES